MNQISHIAILVRFTNIGRTCDGDHGGDHAGADVLDLDLALVEDVADGHGHEAAAERRVHRRHRRLRSEDPLVPGHPERAGTYTQSRH